MDEITPQQAIRHFGGVKQTAEALGCSRQTVYNWLSVGKGLPPQWQALVREKMNDELKD